MPETFEATFEALAVAALALLPGALFIWAVERVTGSWGVKHVDRLLRFLAVSLGIQVLASPITYWAWFRFIAGSGIAKGKGIPFDLYLVALGYLGVPYVIGWIIGRALLEDRPWARWVFGVQGQPPRAWDHIWSQQPTGYCRLLLKTDPPTWVAGLLGRSGNRTSYAAIYPEENPDIYLARRLECDEETGDLVYDGTAPKRMRGALLLKQTDVLLLEIIEPNSS